MTPRVRLGVTVLLFNRARYDAQRTVEAFGARLRGRVDPDAVAVDLVSAAGRAREPATIGPWVRG
jgi:hypothetical protein